ncbi:tryptophan 7-halogenase [Streptomyces sp. NPDC006512]|uniref:tryptophan 7-halogenase n=1 Tax=Streptomyces sp. NPDC006512 TaxID=3154307 RepID=UPI0033B2DA19
MDKNADRKAPTPLTDVVIAGGTLTAWIAAARLASAFPDTVRITVLETADRPSIQVTALAPTAQRDLFDPLGVFEDEWMRAADASFSAAVKYTDRSAPHTHVYVPRSSPLPDCEGFPLSDAWTLRRACGQTVEPADRACFREPPLMDAKKSPRWLDGRAAIAYGWHADTTMLTHFLRVKAVRTRGVRLLTGDLLGADRDAHGRVTSLHTTRGTLAADLVLDCTGESRLLIAGVLAEPFTDETGLVPADSTVTLTAPHDSALHGVEPYTTATATPAGWTWRLPLLGRYGAGLAYASARTTPDEAARQLLDTHGARDTPARAAHTRHRPGRPRRSWVHNCVALGAAAGLTDPLAEDHAATLDLLDRLIRDFPSPDRPDAPAARFNRAAAAHHERALDLLRLRHPARHPLPLSDTARAALEAHRAGLSPTPDEQPLRTLLTAFSPRTGGPSPALARHPAALRAAEEHFTRIKRHQHTLLETLPTAHDYLARLHSPRTHRTARSAERGPLLLALPTAAD